MTASSNRRSKMKQSAQAVSFADETIVMMHRQI
jgi:hypothetical protein